MVRCRFTLLHAAVDRNLAKEAHKVALVELLVDVMGFDVNAVDFVCETTTHISIYLYLSISIYLYIYIYDEKENIAPILDSFVHATATISILSSSMIELKLSLDVL